MNKSDFFVYSFFVQLNICIVACLENSCTIHNIFALHGRYIFSYFNTCVENSSLSLKFKLRSQLKRDDTVWQVEMSRGKEKERWCWVRVRSMPFDLLMVKMRLVENSANNVDINKWICFSPYNLLWRRVKSSWQSQWTRNGKPGNFILGCAECDEDYKNFSRKKCSVAGRFLQ